MEAKMNASSEHEIGNFVGSFKGVKYVIKPSRVIPLMTRLKINTFEWYKIDS